VSHGVADVHVAASVDPRSEPIQVLLRFEPPACQSDSSVSDPRPFARNRKGVLLDRGVASMMAHRWTVKAGAHHEHVVCSLGE